MFLLQPNFKYTVMQRKVSYGFYCWILCSKLTVMVNGYNERFASDVGFLVCFCKFSVTNSQALLGLARSFKLKDK